MSTEHDTRFEHVRIAQFVQDLVIAWGGTYIMAWGGLQPGVEGTVFEVRQIGSPPQRFTVTVEYYDKAELITMYLSCCA